MIVRVRLYSMLDTVVISGKYVCCSVVIYLTGFRHRSSGDKSVGCLLQANKCLTYCGEATQSVQMKLGSPNTQCL